MGSNTIDIEVSEDTYAKVHLFGATVTSWVNKGTEQLFLSGSSKLDGSKAVRGGIPVVFPNFGPWSRGPQHGFARTSWWKLTSNKKLDSGHAKAVFTLQEDENTKSMWDHKFQLQYEVDVTADELKTSLTITNTGTDAFDFTTLLHTYLKVTNINQCTITGFNGHTYTDKISKEEGKTESREEIKISENVDRVYAGTESHVVTSPGRQIRVEKCNLPDTVLWNPWSVKAKEMSDFDDDGYLEMVCVEPGHVVQRKELPPGETFACSQKLTVLQ